MKWGVCTTAKAPLTQLLAFVAWHRAAGAAHIWVHLDDADEITGHVLNQLDDVTAILCDDAYWAVLGMRPNKQEPRQSYNMQRIYAEAALPVIAHVDIDEYLYCTRSISDVLDDWDDDFPFMRVAPAEALNDPSLPDDIFTARQFRLPFPNGMPAEKRMDVLGDYTALLKKNMLSHKVGKSFFKTGIKGLIPKIHAGSFGKKEPPLHVPVTPEIVVLHFHAQDKADWLAALPHRTVNGAYRFNETLAAFLEDASATEVDAFYEATQVATPQLVSALATHGLLVEADLRLRDKVEALF
ncbi:glycosyltransferase family 2 protein [Octadecabacter sp. 1_MG-2023]|uniref:glycosyltransferase family 2 protein n=1 Tax=unclassified Octadecabacter TaxID=196158 RepID=UPI001C0A5D4B|nr:glycosyltransferase family 2 protein [Octadecabacter sp. 1_MG-2023]MBU2992578.1 glycosyltransferase family 2 protein [Octadecabacter sp. B2R22]MDO6734665.1 glycosyltransferase family 2 protein [Octadecabacter sp. 1_MG-2023]